MTNTQPLRSSIRAHYEGAPTAGVFVSVHTTQAQAERALDTIESVRGGNRPSRTTLVSGLHDSTVTYQIWNV